MTKTIKNFKKMLIQIFNSSLNKLILEMNKELICNPNASKNLKNLFTQLKSLNTPDEFLNWQQKVNNMSFSVTITNYLAITNNICYGIASINNKRIILSSEILDVFFEFIEISNQEKLEIIAFYLNRSLDALYVTNDEDRYFVGEAAYYQSEIDSSKENKEKSLNKCVTEEEAKLIDTNNAERLRSVISRNGMILPNKDALELSSIWDETYLAISRLYYNQILIHSTLLAKNLEEQHNQEYVGTRIVEDIDPSILKEQKQKIHASKIIVNAYLNDLMPKRLLSPDEIDSLMDALHALNYNEEIIKKIKKNIVKVNDGAEIFILKRKIKDAQKEYLSSSEIDILLEVETILDNEDNKLNNYHSSLLINYNYLIQLLLETYNAETNNIENGFIMLCIEDIITSLNLFKSSQYNFILNRNKNEDNND